MFTLALAPSPHCSERRSLSFGEEEERRLVNMEAEWRVAKEEWDGQHEKQWEVEWNEGKEKDEKESHGKLHQVREEAVRDAREAGEKKYAKWE